MNAYLDDDYESNLKNEKELLNSHNPSIKYEIWKSNQKKKEFLEKARYDEIVKSFPQISNEFLFLEKPKCSFGYLIDKSKRNKGKDFFICYCNLEAIICRECAKTCHKIIHTKQEINKLTEIVTKFNQVETNLRKNNPRTEKKFRPTFVYKKDTKLNQEDLNTMREINLSYAYYKYKCEKENTKPESRDGKFLERFARKKVRQFRIQSNKNFELSCSCGENFHNIENIKNPYIDIENTETKKTSKCLFTSIFANTLKTTNFYQFEKQKLSSLDISQIEYIDENNERTMVNKFVDEMKLFEERRKLLTEKGKRRMDSILFNPINIDHIVSTDLEKRYYCAYCVDNCIMPHFQFKKNIEDIPVKIKANYQEDISCNCQQHFHDYSFDYDLNVNQYSLNFNFGSAESQINYFENDEKFDFNDVNFLFKLDIFRVFDLMYHHKYFVFDKMRVFPLLDYKNPELLISFTKKVIMELCNEKVNNNSNLIDHKVMHRSFSSKIILLYMIYHKTCREYFIRTYFHFNINSIVNMTVMQRYAYLYQTQRYIFEKKPTSVPEFCVFKDQIILFILSFISYMEQDLEMFYESVENDNFYLIHKFFKWVFKYSFSIIFNKSNEAKLFYEYGNREKQVLEKRYFQLVTSIFNKNKIKRKRDLSQSSYYIIKSVFYIVYKANDKSYYKTFIKGKNDEDSPKVFFENPIYELLSTATIMAIDHYDSSQDPKKSLKFHEYSKYIFDCIIDKNKIYNAGINNLYYLKKNSFNILSNIEKVRNNYSIFRKSEFCKKISDFFEVNFNYQQGIKNEDFESNKISSFDKFTEESENLLEQILSELELTDYSKNLAQKLEFNKIQLNGNRSDIYNYLHNNVKVLEKFQKKIIFSKFVETFDFFTINYIEALTRDVDYDKCSKRLSRNIRQKLLKFILCLIYDNPENFCLIMSLSGERLTRIFLQNRKGEISEYNQITYENLDLKEYLKFLSILGDLIVSSNYKFTNLKFFTDCMITTVTYIRDYRNLEIDILNKLKNKKSSNDEEIVKFNELIESNKKLIDILFEKFSETVGKSEDEKNKKSVILRKETKLEILLKIKKFTETNELDDYEFNEEESQYFKTSMSLYKLKINECNFENALESRIKENQRSLQSYHKEENKFKEADLIDILSRQSIARITRNLGSYLKIFSKILPNLSLMRTEVLDCLEFTVNTIRDCSKDGKIYNFCLEEFVKNKIPYYEKDAIEKFITNYLKLYCSVHYNALGFMRIFKYDAINGRIFNSLKKEYTIPEKLPISLQIELFKFVFTQIELEYDLKQPIYQEIPFKSEFFWMAQKKPRFLYENDEKKNFNPRLALSFALKAMDICEKATKNDGRFYNEYREIRKNYYASLVDSQEKFRDDLIFKDESLNIKEEKNEFKEYRNCIKYYQECCLKAMFFLTSFEEIYLNYENKEMSAVIEIIIRYAELTKKVFKKILTQDNYNKFVKFSHLYQNDVNKFLRNVYFNKFQIYTKLYLESSDEEYLDNFLLKKDALKMRYFKIEENTRLGRKLLHIALKYEPIPREDKPFDDFSPKKFNNILTKFKSNPKIMKFFTNILQMYRNERKIENNHLSLVKVFCNNEENTPLHNIFLDIVIKSLFTKISHYKISDPIESYKLNYFEESREFKICYQDLEWGNSIYLYFLNVIFSYNSQIFQRAFYSKMLKEKEKWNDFMIFLICYYCWNLSLHSVMRTRDLLDLRVKSNFIIDLNLSAIKILQNLCEGHNKTFQDYLFSFEFDVKTVKDLFWGKTIYISKGEIDKKSKYKIYNFINVNIHNLSNGLKRRMFPKDKGVLAIIQKYIDLIVEMIQGTSLTNLKTVTSRLKFLDVRTQFENEFNFDSVKKEFYYLKKTDDHLTNKKFFRKHGFHKYDNLENFELVKKISLEKYLKSVNLYMPEYFDFYSLVDYIKGFLVNDYYIVDELTVRLQTSFFDYFNNILKSDIDYEKKNGIEVFTKFFKVEEIIILVMKYFIILKYKYRHNNYFKTKKEVKTQYQDAKNFKIENKENNENTRKFSQNWKKLYPEPKMIDLDDVFNLSDNDELNIQLQEQFEKNEIYINMKKKVDEYELTKAENERIYNEKKEILKKSKAKEKLYIEYKAQIEDYHKLKKENEKIYHEIQEKLSKLQLNEKQFKNYSERIIIYEKLKNNDEKVYKEIQDFVQEFEENDTLNKKNKDKIEEYEKMKRNNEKIYHDIKGKVDGKKVGNELYNIYKKNLEEYEKLKENNEKIYNELKQKYKNSPFGLTEDIMEHEDYQRNYNNLKTKVEEFENKKIDKNFYSLLGNHIQEEKKNYENKVKFNQVTYAEYHELKRIYKQKAGSLYYNLGSPVYIYDDPIFQSACKLMIFLKILGYKYDVTEVQKIIDLDLSPYIEDKKMKDIEEKQNNFEESNKNQESKSEDLKKIEKVIQDLFENYNYNYSSKIHDHKFLSQIKFDEYKDTLIFCLQFFNMVIKSCDFVFPANSSEIHTILSTSPIKDDVIDSEDDKDEKNEDEDEETENSPKKHKNEESENTNLDNTFKNFKGSSYKRNTKTNQTILKIMKHQEESEKIHYENDIDFDFDVQEHKNENTKTAGKHKKKKQIVNKNVDEDENDFDEEFPLDSEFIEENLNETNEKKENEVLKEDNENFVFEESQKLKKLHFIFNPKYYYLISKKNIDGFFKYEADRSSPSSKISTLLDTIDKFIIEIKFQSEVNHDQSKIKIIDFFRKEYIKNFALRHFFDRKVYSLINMINFYISLSAIVYLFLYIDSENYLDYGNYFFVMCCLGSIVSINIFTILMFLFAKYNYFVEIEKKIEEANEKIKKTERSFYNNLRKVIIHNILNPFLFNEEIIFLIINLITSFIISYNPHLISLLCVQLITIINFYDKIAEIFKAFTSKISQLFTLIIFLAILIYIYSFIGFMNLQGEFTLETDSGYLENQCKSLIQCGITYFNNGVRAGGGIGDILSMRSFQDSRIYAWRYWSDMVFYITVILLLLNMVNGVIVTTFSQIRQDREIKEEDEENRCFICSINRVEFEKRKIPFDEHTNKEHSYKTYIQYLLHLKFKNEDEMDYDESFISKCVDKKDVGCFPIKRAFSIGRGHEINDEEEDE